MDRGASFERPNASKTLDLSTDLASPFGPPHTPVNLETPLADITQQTDCTVYQSPPPAKHPRLAPTSLFQPPHTSTTSSPSPAELTDAMGRAKDEVEMWKEEKMRRFKSNLAEA